jgi:hypothetical protein
VGSARLRRAEQQSAAGKPCKRDDRHLPVPVDAGVKDERDVGRGGCRDDWAVSVPESHQEREPEDRQHEEQAERAYFGQRLEIETVCVLDVDREWALLVPANCIRAGARTEEWMRLVVVPGGCPVVGTLLTERIGW